MNRIFKKIVFLLVLFIHSFGCTEKELDPIVVSSITLNVTSIEMTEGDTQSLVATISPSNATNKTVTWSSSDKTVASVSAGKVTALKAGNATITVTTEDGGKTASCEVIVRIKSLEDWEEGENVEDEI